MLLRLFYLDTFVNAPISSTFLDSIQADFDSIRAQGDKAIVRFAYNQDQTRPFDEPSKAQILAHIEQLKPLLKKNADVIAVVQLGFIGAWGEGYYSDNFYTGGQATPQNWMDRADVLGAVLDALPPERMVQVRTPQMKQKFVYGPTAPTDAAGLNPAQAFDGSGPARIGFHNDCYLADSTDFGTFSDYDVGGGTSQQDITNLRNYVAQDSRFAPVGGETCAVNPPTDDCGSAGGNADPDMAFSHYSFLNQGYNANVNNDWETQGCMDDIKRRLGYRLELLSGIFRTEAQPGQVIPITLEFTNVGFASPYNPRGLELVLRNTSSGKKFFAELSRDTDARRWLPGAKYTLKAQLALPADMPTGVYEYLLNLPDPAPSLYGITAYWIPARKFAGCLQHRHRVGYSMGSFHRLSSSRPTADDQFNCEQCRSGWRDDSGVELFRNCRNLRQLEGAQFSIGPGRRRAECRSRPRRPRQRPRICDGHRPEFAGHQ